MKIIDVVLALLAGEGTGWLFVWFLKDSTIEFPFLNWILPICFPLLALIGIWVASKMGKKFPFVYQLAKFLLIGVVFALFDLVILNFLMNLFGITKGIQYSVFVAVSFLVVTTVKYIANKFWAFEKTGKEQIGLEMGGFFIFTLISGGIQIAIASLLVNVVGPLFGITPLVWANVGKIIGIALASIWNFLGYKFIVFKK